MRLLLTLMPLLVIVAASWIVAQRLALAASASVELLRADAAGLNEETRRKVASFAALGYRELAVYEARFRGGEFNIVVMAGPGATSWAEVTDRLWEVASTFGPRLLRTATRSMLPPGPVLVQGLPSATPEAIVAEHERALAVLGALGLRPDRLDDGELVSRFESETWATQALLERSRWRTAVDLAWRMPLRRHHGRPVVANDSRAGARIDAWLAGG